MSEKLTNMNPLPSAIEDGDLLYVIRGGQWYKAGFSDLPSGNIYAVYTALVSQSETDNPTVIELVNTLGITITWTREATGDYKGTPSTSFADIDKIWFPSGVSNQGDEFVVSSVVQSVSDIRLYVIDSGSLVDGLENFPIEIRIYT